MSFRSCVLWSLLSSLTAAPAAAQRPGAQGAVSLFDAGVTGDSQSPGTPSSRDPDALARDGFNAWVQCTVPVGAALCKATIPIGPNEMAVVESIAGSMFTGQAVSGVAVPPSGQVWAQSPRTLGGVPSVVNLAFSMAQKTSDYFYASQPIAVRIYATRTTSIELQGFKPDDFADQEATLFFNVTGYVIRCGPARASYDCPAPRLTLPL